MNRKLRLRRITAVFGTVLLLLTLLFPPFSSGCGKKGAEDPSGGISGGTAGGENGEGFLTHIFRPTVYPLPEGYSFNSSFVPRWNGETEELTFFAAKWDNREGEDGVWQSEQSTKIVTASPDGILSEEDFALSENETLSNGVFTDNGLIWMTSAYDEARGEETYRLYSRKDGAERAECGDVKSLFESVGMRGWFHVDRLAADGDGYVYLSSEQEIVVLTPELDKLFSLTLPDWINTMAADGSGTVWVTGYFGNGPAMCPVDRGTRSLGDPLDLPDGVNELFFGPGHDFYYRDDNGLFAADFDGNGKASGELIFDFLNSDVSRETISLLAVYGPETVMTAERGNDGQIPSVYRRAPDVDLSQITVLRMVHTHQLDYRIAGKVVAFNKAHDNVRLVTESYESDGDYYEGEKRLALELSTGTERPDIAVVSQTGAALTQIVRRGLFTDLTPYMEPDGILNRDNIMGCVKRTFTDREGRLFGLTETFTIRTMITTDALLGKYAGRDSWTPEELLDFALSLPADRILIENLTRETAPNLLLGPSGFGAFADEEAGSCSFDSDLFIRYLNYIASLPTQQEYEAHPPLEDLNADRSERYRLYHEGKIVLKQKWMHDLVGFLGAELDYGTKDWRLIGMPSSGDCGTAINAESVYVITAADKERADLAWEALEALMTPPEWRAGQGIPALVSEFEKEVRDYYTYDFAFTYSGGASWGTKNPDRPRELREPGILTEFTEEDERRIRDLLNNHCGVPYALAAEEDVTAIAEEEISAFLGGLGTAEDCAKKIQSRVSILLAERG